jgi:ketosteroid isomerase-like protein
MFSKPLAALGGLALACLAIPQVHAQAPVTAARGASAAAQAADLAAIRAVGETWRTLYEVGRFSEIPDLYTEDTLVMPRGRPRIEGRAAMRRAIGGLAAGRRVGIVVTEREAQVAGRFGWFVSDFTVTYTPRTPGEPVTTEHGRSLILYRKDSDGRWRIHRDMDSPAPQPAPVAGAPPAAATAAAAARPARALWDPAARTEVTACDRMTASRYDRTRLAPPVAREGIDVPAAIAQCEADLVRFPNDARLLFQLGRVQGYAGDRAKTRATREAAAAAGNHNAIFLLGYLDWAAAKDDAARCAAADEMKLAADRGNYSAQITYASYFLEGRLAACPARASAAEVDAYLAAARPAVDGFFETRLVEHLAHQARAR